MSHGSATSDATAAAIAPRSRRVDHDARGVEGCDVSARCDQCAETLMISPCGATGGADTWTNPDALRLGRLRAIDDGRHRVRPGRRDVL